MSSTSCDASTPVGGENIQNNNQERMLSRLLMGYAEKNISPHTIADVVRTQLMDIGLKTVPISENTCNGIVEILTSVSNSNVNIDILLYFTTHPSFPKFLSHRATCGLILSFIKYLPMLQDRAHSTKLAKIGQIIEILSSEIFLLHEAKKFSNSERTRIINSLKALPENLKNWLNLQSPSITLLKSTNPSEEVTQRQPTFNTNTTSTPEDVFHNILQVEEHVLAQKGLSQFRMGKPEILTEWKISNILLVIESASGAEISPLRRAFLLEWYFEGLLRETFHNSNFSSCLNDCLKTVIDNLGLVDGTLKGILRALQRDISLTATELNYPTNKHPRYDELLINTQQFFLSLLQTSTRDINFVTKNFASWAQQIPAQPPESRLFTRNSWQWIRSLANSEWEDDLRELPVWLLTQANKYAAQLFRIAPHFWLQTHAASIIERLHMESILPGFNTTKQHLDYAEYLCRTLRKKSPLFASRNEILLALRLLSRTTLQEENQLTLVETRYRMTDSETSIFDLEKQFWIQHFRSNRGEERFGSNPVARALYVLLYTAKHINKAQIKQNT